LALLCEGYTAKCWLYCERVVQQSVGFIVWGLYSKVLALLCEGYTANFGFIVWGLYTQVLALLP